VGLPEDGSESSMALSSWVDMEEIEETEPLRSEKLDETLGGDPLALERLIRRWLFAWAAAEVIGPG